MDRTGEREAKLRGRFQPSTEGRPPAVGCAARRRRTSRSAPPNSP